MPDRPPLNDEEPGSSGDGPTAPGDPTSPDDPAAPADPRSRHDSAASEPQHVRRTAALVATAVALPVAVVVGLLVGLSGRHDAAPKTSPEPRTPVTASPPPAAGDPTHLCPALVAALPATLAGHRRRPVSGVPATRAAAWGDPPIVLRCGVPRPASLVPGSPLITVQGVDWDTYPLGGSVRWTAVSRRVYVEVLVPDAYPGQGGLVATIAPVIAQHDPKA